MGRGHAPGHEPRPGARQRAGRGRGDDPASAPEHPRLAVAVAPLHDRCRPPRLFLERSQPALHRQRPLPPLDALSADCSLWRSRSAASDIHLSSLPISLPISVSAQRMYSRPSVDAVEMGGVGIMAVHDCQRRSKSTPLAGVKMHHLMRFSSALAVVPVVHRRDPRCFV